MSPCMTAIVPIAIAGLITLSALTSARQRSLRQLLCPVAALAGIALLLHRLFDFPIARPIPASKAMGSNELPVIGLLFACMLLGMLAHWLYVWLETPQRKRPPFDLGLFLGPVMASPIIFIPLLASLQNTDLNLSQIDIPRFMVFVVAFENGFLWKEYFDNRKKKTVP